MLEPARVSPSHTFKVEVSYDYYIPALLEYIIFRTQDLKCSNRELVLTEKSRHLPDILDCESGAVMERGCGFSHWEKDGSALNMRQRFLVRISGAVG